MLSVDRISIPNRINTVNGAVLRLQVRRGGDERGARRRAAPTGDPRDRCLRGQLSANKAKIVVFYDKHGASPDTVAADVLDAIARPRLIVVSPPSHVLAPYVLHRLSPRLTQPLARNLTKILSRG